METLGGLIEKDVQGKELKFYIPANLLAPDTIAAALPAAPASASGLGMGSPPADSAVVDDASTAGLERVFIHPSSINFANTAFRPSNYLLYGERQLSVTLGGGGSSSSAGGSSSNNNNAGGSTDRAYIRDTSEVIHLASVSLCHALSVSFFQSCYSISLFSLLPSGVSLSPIVLRRQARGPVSRRNSHRG